MSTKVHARRVVAPVALRLLGLSAAIAGLYPLAAAAQIEEVIVTTRKREESLQEVPIAVSVISAEQITRQGVTDLRKVVELQPSVQFDQAFGPADNRITIRGLSNTRGRSNVAFLVDGIDVTTENLVVAGSGLLANRRLLTDVQNIEIVKGPQSALYGRAAFAGALSYTTKEPGDEFDGRVALDVGDYGRRNIEAAFGGPITDTFGMRVTGTTWNEDGFYRNTVSGQSLGQQEGYGAAVTSVWKPVDGVKSKLRVEYTDEEFGPRPVVRIAPDQPYWIPNGGPRFQDGLGNVRPDGDARFVVRGPITGDPSTQPLNTSTATNLFNFGLYCPDQPQLITTPVNPNDPPDVQQAQIQQNARNLAQGFDPTQDPGFCLPSIIGDSSGYRPTLSLDPQTGGDFEGTTAKTFRLSWNTSIDVSTGTFSSNTGWTDFDADDIYDQDYQNAALGFQLANTTTNTNQFSQELRFRTDLDGPVQFTVGALYWAEERKLRDRNLIISCAPIGKDLATIEDLVIDGETVLSGNTPVKDVSTGDVVPAAGVCDGTNGSLSTPQEVYQKIVNSGFLNRGDGGVIWEADTRHWSFYGALDWNLTDELQVTLETRFVDEKFTLLRPSSSSCTEIAFQQGVPGTSVRWLVVDQGVAPRTDITICDADRIRDNIPPFPLVTGGAPAVSWGMIEGSTNSRFNTPKVTLKWQPLDDLNLYFSWGNAQKPGGINQLAAGAAPTTIANERFDPEKLDAWEIGLKTAFEAGGFWRLNLSGFLNDYTDKQVGIQAVDANGFAQPRVVNAGKAEVWGFEFDAVWQPNFMEGLAFTLAGTILDAKYTQFIDDTGNLIKAARVGSCPPVWKGVGFETTDPNDPRIGESVARQCRLDYAGNQLERTPRQSYAASMVIQRPFFDTEFEYLFQVEGSWQDKRWTEPENLVQLDDYATMNLRLGLTSDSWEVLAYLDNALDQDTFTTAGSGPDFGRQVSQLGFTAGFGTSHYFATLPDPRVFGVRANFRFGDGR